MAHRQHQTALDLTSAEAANFANRLGSQSSLYLQQHADNPIAWQPWDEAALALALRLDRPILLSSGYSSCHWCHRMAQESFDDPSIAEIINAAFVPIKVDREERPDIDDRYQRAVEMLTGRRGWPLTLFLTPVGEAFAGGAYFPPTADPHLPAFRDILLETAHRYRRGDIPARITNPSNGRVVPGATASSALDQSALDHAAMTVLTACDPLAGGVGGAPKFPHLPLIDLLLRASERIGEPRFAAAARRALDAMCSGALYDPIDGGFARYCSDAHWQVPHYEKMLYDNAQFVATLSHAHRQHPSILYAGCVRETIAWMDHRLALPNGAFGASLSAESRGTEGGAQRWSLAEISEALGGDTRFFASIYAVPASVEPPAPLRRLRRALSASQEERVRSCLVKLRRSRANYPSAPRDDKLIAQWNGLAIRGLALAAATFGVRGWLSRAEHAFQTCDTIFSRSEDRLWRVPDSVEGMLGDYAAMGLAALALHDATGVDIYLRRAQCWAEISKTIVQSSTVAAEDDAISSGPALALELLARLAALHEFPADPDFLIERFAGVFAEAAAQPLTHAGLLNAADTAMRPTSITLLVGDDDTISRHWRMQLLGHADAATVISSNQYGGGQIRAVLCRDRQCSPPLADLASACVALGERGVNSSS